MASLQTRQGTADPAAGHPPETGKTQRIAVLFTDVVGSTRYFKTRGDTAGRKMLQRHVAIASAPIAAENGVLVKTIGDAVMAYFVRPLEAVRAAVAIQTGFRRHNSGRSPENRIHVRIGIHYGRGIVEKQDIFGNVVNLAAKLMPMVGGDQIFVTEAVHTPIRNACPVPVEPLPAGKNGSALSGIGVFNLVWHRAATAAPARGAIVLFRRHPNLGGQPFAGLWERLAGMRRRLWGARVVRDAFQGDQALVAVRTVPEAVELAGEVLAFFQGGMKPSPAVPLVPVQILIDHKDYPRDQPLPLPEADLAALEPGMIHLTADACGRLKGAPAYPLRPVDAGANGGGIRVLLTSLTHGKHHRPKFLYQAALSKGSLRPCFYCGSRRHAVSDCPSKSMEQPPAALNRLGRLSLALINRAFFSWLAVEPVPSMAAHGESGANETPARLALKSHCDLSFHYQLRFFRILWGAGADNWETVRQSRPTGSRGGPVWLALDCIRTGNLAQAEHLLNRVTDRHGDDYRTHCTTGLLEVEKGALDKAELHFNQAAEAAKTDAENIFTGLLTLRTLEIGGDPIRAEKFLRRLLARHPQCADLRYAAIKYKFYSGQEKQALSRLIDLVKSHRRFYLHAMIDPDLAHVSDKIQRQLDKILAMAQRDVTELLPRAAAEVKRFEGIYSAADPEVDREKSLLAHIEKPGVSDSYFDCLDVADAARAIVGRVRGTIEGRKRSIGRTLRDLELRCRSLVSRARALADARGVKRILSDLAGVYKEVIGMREMVDAEHPEIFVVIFDRSDQLSERLDHIARAIKRAADFRDVCRFLVAFFNRSLVIQSINLIIGIGIFPLINHYLGFIIPPLRVADPHLFFYQKLFLCLGGLTGTLAAVLMTARSVYPR
jgi:class 3 adenylate cyclase/tetratricopeptide (TPR) repeat protein